MFDDAPEPAGKSRDAIETATDIDRPDEAVETSADPPDSATEPTPVPPDLDVIEADLADVEVALERLDNGEYWRDETTGEPLDEAVLQQHPTARRNA